MHRWIDIKNQSADLFYFFFSIGFILAELCPFSEKKLYGSLFPESLENL